MVLGMVCVINGAVEQCRSGKAGAHLNELDIEAAFGEQTFLGFVLSM
jgi:hypothetical protein